MLAALVTLTLALAASAYQITSPNNSSGWTTTATNTVTWQRVDTDPTNFTIVLVNQDRSVLPQNDLVLMAQVDGTKLSTAVNAPSGGWPTGEGFQVNFVQDQNDVNTIYAQSNQFEIKAGTSSSTSGSTTSKGTSSTGTTSTASSGSLIGNTATTTGSSDTTNPSGTSTDTSSGASTTSNAASPLGASTGLMGLVVLLGSLLA